MTSPHLPLTQPPSSLESISRVIETIHRLRAPDGCPWDRAQTHHSLRPHLIEEAYEALEILDQIHTTQDIKNPKLSTALKEELGDVLMQILLHAELAQEEGAFDIYQIAEGLNQKLIRRHPHVFGEIKEDSAENAVKRWEKEKAKEKKGQTRASVLDGVPKGLPTLQRSTRVIQKVTRVGFQWEDMAGPLAKVDEEFQELKAEILKLEQLERLQKTQAADVSPQLLAHQKLEQQTLKHRIESELGDLLFTISNVACLNHINPEDALRGTLTRFEKRFRHVESRIQGLGKALDQSNQAEMDVYWNEAKQLEKIEVWGLTGGIASGKSSVATCFKSLGIPVIDADQLSRELSEEGGAAHARLLQRFGTADRALLRELVFSNPAAKQDLESILHPLIQAKSTEQILELAKTHSKVIYEASLLVETGRAQTLQGLITVEAPSETRIARLVDHRHLDPTLAQRIIATQASDDQRRSQAQFVIDNTGTLAELKEQVLHWIRQQGWL
jgi:dephospho-CoA kinase